MDPDQSLEVLVQHDVLQQICQQLTFEEAVQLAQTNKNLKITCPIRISDPDHQIQFLPGINPLTIRVYKLIKEHGSIAVLFTEIHNEQITNLLLKAKLNPVGLEFKSKKVLLSAAEAGNQPLVEYLINSGANVNETSRYSEDTAINFAVTGNHLNIVKLLVKAGSRLDGMSSPLIQAAILGREEIVRYFIDSGLIPINTSDLGQNTALIAAAGSGNLSIVKYLIEKGANIHSLNNNGNNALTQAITYGHFDLAQFLIEQGLAVQDRAVYNAVLQNKPEMVKLLLEHGGNPNPRFHGQTALILAVTGGYFQVVQVLLNGGANPKLTNAQGETAYEIAIAENLPEIAELLRNFI